ncbi:putative Serine/threonine-protein phosphatase PP1 [Monocercomonoides exilis]|uniref:putative Serine/threonine-protein phosphatase PP1 n=1 Tax=Monocercomonoides exilis TaxID=2049356 RepID=UPI00355A5610|nr:putative Serine/threonine-protein phosphatase PP1 [Monocercomonoides exilis]|eukprot:MONOS_9701.1-p1 / transcript=MONOS_9701.1 / gene=MONOS_9701 / organism=Monocercomonoides_exilis_PA203 / gene_product=protein serine / transcript_product=protein serine / location=Mono_scaffold00410:39719-45855(-) / protein_length=1695 / sequence_SO=supercontig / SO=protein_coding / is_pseudo=false
MFYILGNIALDSSDLTLFCLQQDVVPSIVFLLADEHTHSQVVSAVLFALSRLCKNGLLVDREIERKENEKDIIGNTQCSNSIATETYDSLTSEEIQLAHESGEDVSVDASNSESKDLTTEQYLWAIEAARVKKAFTSAEIDLCQSIHSLAAVKDGSANPIATAAFQQDSSTDAFSPMTSDEAGATSTADSASQEIPPSYHKLLEAAMSGESSSNALSISHSMQLLSTVPLISSFLYGEDLDRAADSLFALMFLSASSHYAKEFIVNQQLLSIIAELMISSKNNGILLYGVRIFSTISTGPASYTQALFDASGLDALDLCLWRQDEEVSFMAMATLHTLSFGHIRHLVLIGTHKVFQSMCDLINSLSFPHIQLMLPVIEKILRSSLTACIVALKGDIVISLIHLLRTMCPSAAASSSIEMEREGNTVTLKKTDRPNVAMPKLYPEDKDEIEISVNLSSLPANFLISLLNILVMLTNYCQQESDRLEKNRRLMMHKTRGRAIPSINPKKKVQISLGQKRVVIESPFESCDGKMEMDASEEEEEEDDDDDDDYGDESSNFEESEGELGEKKKFENRVVWQMRERGFDNELMELARHKNQNVKERAMLLLASIHNKAMSLQFSFIAEGSTRVSHSSLFLQQAVYYMFGESGKQENREYINSAIRYDTASGTMQHVPLFVSGKPAKPRASHTTTPISYDRFLCFGGNYHLELLNECLVGQIPDGPTSHLNLDTLLVNSKTPCHRRGHAAVALGDTHQVFVMGGNSQESCLNDVHIFDAGASTWRCVSPHSNPYLSDSLPDTTRPGPRTNHALIPLWPGSSAGAALSTTLGATTTTSGMGLGMPSCVLLYGGQWTRMRSTRAVQGPLVYEDAWLFDTKAEKWHKLKLNGHTLCNVCGKRMGHALAPIWSQPASALLFGGGPDVSKMQMCNDAYILDLRMMGMLPTSSATSSATPSSVAISSFTDRGGGSVVEDYSMCECAPYLLQPGSVPRRSIAPRMFHTMDAIDDGSFLVFGGYAGHRTCGGLWAATLSNCEWAQREKARKKAKHKRREEKDRERGMEKGGDSKDKGIMRHSLPEAADPSQMYHHLPFISSPFRPADPNRVPIKEVVLMKEGVDGSAGEVVVVPPLKKHFPSAFERDAPTTGTMPRSYLVGASNSDIGGEGMGGGDGWGGEGRSISPSSSPGMAMDSAAGFGGVAIDPSVDSHFVDGMGEVNYPLLNTFIDYAIKQNIRFLPTAQQVWAICDAVLPLLRNEASLLQVKPPCKVFGDIHGDYEALLKFFENFGDPRERTDLSYLFLGDYVDRGEYSVLVVVLLFALKLRYPTRIFLLRGNHEARAMCGDGHGYSTLLSECLNLYHDPSHSPENPSSLSPSQSHSSAERAPITTKSAMEAEKAKHNTLSALDVWNIMVDTFDYLPYAAVIGRTIFAVHGGLSHALPTLNQIYLIPRGRAEEPGGSGTSGAEGVESVRGGGALGVSGSGARGGADGSGSFNYRFGPDAPPVLTPAQELLWNDASRTEDQIEPWVANQIRRCGFYFNGTVVDNFCKQNGLKLIVRGHEVCPDGFDYFAKRKLITLFSAPQYCGMDNHGAILDVKRDLSVTLEMLDGRSVRGSVTGPPDTPPPTSHTPSYGSPSTSASPSASSASSSSVSPSPYSSVGSGRRSHSAPPLSPEMEERMRRERAPTPPRRTSLSPPPQSSTAKSSR